MNIIGDTKSKTYNLQRFKLENGTSVNWVLFNDKNHRLCLEYQYVHNIYNGNNQKKINLTHLMIDYIDGSISDVRYNISQHRSSINIFNPIFGKPVCEKTHFNGAFDYVEKEIEIEDAIEEERFKKVLVMETANFGKGGVSLDTLEEELKKSRDYSKLPLDTEIMRTEDRIYRIPFLKMDGQLDFFEFRAKY